MKKRGILALGGLLAIGAAAVAVAAPGAQTGPSSSQSPYVARSQPGVVTNSILTTGDSVNLKADGVTHIGWSEYLTASAPSTTATAPSRC
jgi:hypothetical protein